MDITRRIKDAIEEFSIRRRSTTERLESGLPSFDLATNGGITKGEITEVYDLESGTGKTSFALQYCRGVTSSGGFVLYFSIEQKLSKHILEQHRVDTSRIAICSLGNDEEIIEVLEELSPDLIVIDSLSAVIPTGETLESQYKYVLLRKTFRKIYEAINKNKSTVLLLNQSRVSFANKIYTNRNITTGGISTEQWTNSRIQLRSIGLIHKKFIPVGRTIVIDITYRDIPRNKITIKSDMMFNTGFNIELDLLDLAIKQGVAIRKGNHYIYNTFELGIGRETVSDYLKDNTKVFQRIWLDILEKKKNGEKP